MRRTIILSIALAACLVGQAQNIRFDDYFVDRTLRIDYLRQGNAQDHSVSVVRWVAKNGQWGGSTTQMLDPVNNGDYRIVVKDRQSSLQLYSRTYNTLFSEYCGTAEGATLSVSYQEVVQVPMPKRPVTVCFQRRDSLQAFFTFAEFDYDPKSTPTVALRKHNSPEKLLYNGNPHNKIDVAIIAQGYDGDKKKLKADYQRFTNILFGEEPFASRRDDFNVWGIAGDAGAHYGTLGADRYLMTDSLFLLHNQLDGIPFDHIIIIVNNDKYGGGGIYNFYAVSSTNKMSDMVTPHELGHSIGGLADEYVDEDLSYTEIYKGRFEPVEPNITSLVDFGKKWQDMLPEGTPIPTDPVKGLGKRDCGPIGVYEGAGYQSKGLYRPVTNCMMNYYAHFCPVCQKALNKMFDLYTK